MNDLRIGIIGTGGIGRTHIERVNTNLHGGKIVACADTNTDLAKSVSEKYNIKQYPTGEDLIAAKDIDAFVITTVDAFHEKFVMEAIKAQKYVFCEKPLAPKADACKRIVDAEMAGGKKLVQVGFMRRYDSGYLQLKQAIQNKTYGEPLLLHCAHRNPSVPEDYDTPMAVENSMIHEIDVLRWLLGENYTSAEVRFAKDTRRTHKNLRDPQIMILTTESGIRIDVEAFVNNGNNYEIKCEVVCEDAVLNLPEPSNIRITADTKKGIPIHKDWSTRFVDAYNLEFQTWINATNKGMVVGPTSWDGYVAQVTASAASHARDTQTIVPIKTEPIPKFYK